MDRNLWSHSPGSGHREGADLIGYAVEAVDGTIGRVDRHSVEVDASYLVVDTGPWIFGRQVLLPAGTVLRIDHDTRVVLVDRSKDEIKGAPEFVQAEPPGVEPGYLHTLAGYYGFGRMI
ncbi:hypothetical protein KNE206_59720 [Kitasatospora sp. NE20-6]|uniref:PRC-barrel domain-containing protein n=1 Tax=Kitasatospora sp. NE20-6 TaxID=2859066 RepID=UPI0034DBF6C6